MGAYQSAPALATTFVVGQIRKRQRAGKCAHQPGSHHSCQRLHNKPAAPLCTTSNQSVFKPLRDASSFNVGTIKVATADLQPRFTKLRPFQHHRYTSHFRGQQRNTPANTMAFLFRNKAKSNAELAKSTKDLTLKLSEEQKPNPKVRTSAAIQANHCQADNDLVARRRAGEKPAANEDDLAGHTRYGTAISHSIFSKC